MKFLRGVEKYISKYRRRVLVASSIVFVTALLLAVLGYFKSTIVFVVLFMVAVLPTIYKRWLRTSIGIEFMVFATVIAGFTYGWKTGFIFGALALVASDLMSRTIGEWTLLNAFAIGLAGFIAGHFSQFNLVVVGIAATLVSEMVKQIPTFIVGDINIRMKNIVIAIIHVAFNLWLFVTLSPLIQGWL